MKSVWRTTLPLEAEWSGTLPHLIRPLHVARARRDVMAYTAIEIWFEVDQDLPDREITIWVEATGSLIEHDGDYLGTVFSPEESLVWHVYWKVTG